MRYVLCDVETGLTRIIYTNLRLQIDNSAVRTAEFATTGEDSKAVRRGEAMILIDREVLEGTNLHSLSAGSLGRWDYKFISYSYVSTAVFLELWSAS